MDFFFGKWQKSWKSHGIYSLVPRIFFLSIFDLIAISSNLRQVRFIIFFNGGEQFNANSSNLRQVKLPDLTMGTICMCDCFVSSLLHYV